MLGKKRNMIQIQHQIKVLKFEELRISINMTYKPTVNT